MKNLIRATLILALLITNKNFSQEVEVDSILPVMLDEVIVSTPFGETADENVIKVTKVDLAKMSAVNTQTMKDVLGETPGLSFISTGPGIYKPNIRGLSSNRVVVFNQNIRYENQQWGDEHGIDIATGGVSSVELIKGPASILYGSDAIGGVLYFNPQKYLKYNGIKGDFSTFYNTNYAGFNSTLGVSTTIDEFSLIARASVVENGDYSGSKRPDGYEGPYESTGMESKDFQLALGYAKGNYNSDFRINFNESTLYVPHGDEEGHDEGDHDDDDNHDDDHDDHEEHEEEESYQDIENFIVSWKNDIKFDNSTFTVTAGFSQNLRKEFGHHDEHSDEHGDDDDDDDHDEDHDEDHDGDHDEHGEEAALDMTLRVTSLDWKYVNEKNDNVELAIGGNFVHQTNENHAEEILIPNATKNDMGLFILSHFHFDSSNLMLGARADLRQIDAVGIEKTYSSMTASAGYKKDLSQSSIFRVNLATGYRSPNLSELFSDGEHHGTGRYEIGSSELSVEKNFQTDISFETSNEKSSLLVDLFYNNINDYIFLNPTGAQTDEFMPIYEYAQSDATILGGEIAYSSKTGIDWLSYYASMEYLRGKKKNDGWLPDIPPVTFKLNLDLDFSDKINYEIDILHKARQDKVATFENSTHSNFLVDVSGQYDLNILYPGARAQLFWKVENVFDKYYYDHLSRFKNYGFYDMGRNVSIGLKISY